MSKRRSMALLATAALAATTILIPATESSAHKAALTINQATFADPPKSVRPMYRWWMPLAYTDDDELRRELRDIAQAGAGGVEVSPFVVPGAGNQTNAFLAEYGWGTPAWAHKIEVITTEAARLGLTVDQNLGPAYPPTVPTLNSFNQPEAEQQLIFGREFGDPGTTRTGALPAPATAIPQVTTKLCAPAEPGDRELKVESLGGLAKGDTIIVGAEQVSVTKLGDRTATCATLTTSPVAATHATGESVTNRARTTRIRTLVAQCETACTTTGTIALRTGSVIDVTRKVRDGKLTHTFAQGNGNPWVVIDFLQTASGLIAQTGGYTATQPNYVVDHWNTGGVRIQTKFWDANILPSTRVKGAIFEDSLELGSTQKWTWDFLDSFKNLRGYDAALLLPALAGTGLQGTGTPAFELAGVGPQLREDYRRTLSDLYTSQYVAPMQRWARANGMQFRVQSYGMPVASGDAAAAAGIAEGESLNFGSPNPVGAEQDYRVLAGGAHAAGKNVISTECCAAFFGNYRSSVAGPNVGGQYGTAGDHSQGLLDSVYKAYAGGVNQLVWHGYPYRDAPKGVGSAGRDGSWPGYHPWDIFGVLNVNDEFGPRQANWSSYSRINTSLARTQLVLREGRAVVDLHVYYEDLGLAGSSVGTQQSPQHLLGTDSATSSAGYTYEYLSPGILNSAKPSVLVLNDQKTLSAEGAERLLALARRGTRIFVVGETPAVGSNRDVAALLAQRTVTRVAAEKDLPAALAAAGIRPAVTPASPAPALGLVRREARNATYDFVYNRSAATVATALTLAGDGVPYLLDTWTGEITPIGDYTTGRSGVTVKVRIPAYDKVIIGLAKRGTPTLHAVNSTADVVAADATSVTVRATRNGRVVTSLSDGSTRVAEVTGLAPAQPLTSWTLRAQTWTPGENQYTTVKTDQPPMTLTGDVLPSWQEILPKQSGIGTYTTTVTPAGGDGAYLSLGDVLDTAEVTVNGTPIVVNQSDRGRIDIGAALRPGANVITVRVATTMFNAVKASGDSNYQIPDWQRAGLLGPVVLTPYRDIVLKTR